MCTVNVKIATRTDSQTLQRKPAVIWLVRRFDLAAASGKGKTRREELHGVKTAQTAANNKRREIVDLLAQRGGQTTISTWVALGDVERVRSELEKDVTQLSRENDFGQTLLHLAVAGEMSMWSNCY